MSHWIFIILGLAAGLFVIKIAYVTAIAISIRTTQGALYVSTSQRRIRAVFDELDLKPGQVLMDLGCGDGRALRAARKRSDISVIGYEINPLAYVKARIYSLGAGIDIPGTETSGMKPLMRRTSFFAICFQMSWRNWQKSSRLKQSPGL